jgi:hypothetical protein
MCCCSLAAPSLAALRRETVGDGYYDPRGKRSLALLLPLVEPPHQVEIDRLFFS